jgi:hypothetical protein
MSCNPEEEYPDPLMKSPVDGIRIAWDHTTLTRIAPRLGRNPGYSGYARMITLDDGRLACVYETSDGTIELTFSSNMGESWSWPSVIFSTADNIPPYVPSIVQLADRSIIIACNPRPREPYTQDRKFGIKIRRSTDMGVSWLPEQLIYEAQSTFSDGCWEPALVQLPDGEVQLYFSNEGIYTASNEQNISLFRSHDNGESWTEEPEIVGFREGRRDGMPVPLVLPDKDMLLVSVEDNKEHEFKPTIYREKLSDNWSGGYVDADDPRRAYHPLANPLMPATYAGGPYLSRLHTGEVLLSYQTTLNRQNIWDRSSMAVEIGDDSGTIFSRRSVPFHVPVEKWGLWNSMAVIGDNTPVAISSTNAYSEGRTEVWMIKGHIVPEFELKTGSAVVDGVHDEACWEGSWPYFVGSRSDAGLSATLCADQESVYLAVAMYDPELVATDDFDTSEGFVFQIDTERKGYVSPQEGIFSFQLLPGGQVQVKEGAHGDWLDISAEEAVMMSAVTTDEVTRFEMSVSRDFLSLDASMEHRVGINLVLENHDAGGTSYRESISSNESGRPYTWSPADLPLF